ncbi:helix-turn-helix transcriptional regulator [Cellulomonas sp. zg-ZUI222]|uniref:ArsR/SmtB family transcription factor n=1 Tax=Cellulomonas wangleii TaxID=2816956 RepID=UPI001A93AACE|nr:helix-turn-helix domain-containing protein [Cellulomonas wangleii]MBO0922075.1 helix-turn-helix transcriptional regulator [Cellulomonas wangleii]
MPLTPASIARFAALLGDETRAGMCLALLDGRAWTAGELARHTGVAPSTATEHLSALVGAGALTERRQGRHRYVRLAGPEVARLLEDLGVLAGEPVRPSSFRAVRADTRLRAARTCYDHLAGAAGVALLDGMVGAGFLTAGDAPALTPAGSRWLSGLDVEPGADGRPTVRPCLDWTERREHLGGSLGAALLATALRRGWLLRVESLPRALTVTDAGRAWFRTHLGTDLGAPGGGGRRS